MVSTLVWRDDWLVGIDHIDADHREMVRRFNRLIEAVAARTPTSEGPADEPDWGRVLACLGSLIEHLRHHFVVEEAFLRSIGYPGLAEHKSEHALHLAELSELERGARRAPGACIDEQSLASMKEWLFDHIDEDRGFALFYCRELGAPPGGNRLRQRPTDQDRFEAVDWPPKALTRLRVGLRGPAAGTWVPLRPLSWAGGR